MEERTDSWRNRASLVNNELLTSPSWYLATTLCERTAHLQNKSTQDRVSQIDLDRATRRLQRWRSEPPFDTTTLFADRLAADGITETELLHLLGEPAEVLRGRFPAPPVWLTQLMQAFSRTLAADPVPISQALPQAKLLTFVDVLQPLIEQARVEVREAVNRIQRAHSHLPFEPDSVEETLFAGVPRQLTAMLGRTMALELNVARLQGILTGETPEERFQSFVHHLSQRDQALSLLLEYPVLARQITNYLASWVSSSLEFLGRLTADWEAIRALISRDRDPGVLTELDGEAGDSHRGGRTVMIAKFSSGFRVVYKPRPLAVDVHFQNLLSWLNARGAHPPFRTLEIIDRGGYGWVEFVSFEGCTSQVEIQGFYERQGEYLALLYSLEATDFHCENLIAAGEYPVLLDLEALFHPRVAGVDLALADDAANSTINYSVLRVGLLPERVWGNAEAAGVDISGLGAADGQMTPYKVPYWEGESTDELQLRRKRVTLPGSQNRPTLNGNGVDVLDYEESLVEGFSRMYYLLLRNRDDLLADNGPLAAFAEDEVRVVVRSTMTYGVLLRESFHPDVLRDALDRDRLLDQLWGWVKNCPPLARVIPAECKDLWNGDIPLFTTRPCSRDLWSSSGQRISDFFDTSGLAVVRSRLRRLSKDDLAQQLWFVRASLATLLPGEAGGKAIGYDLIEQEMDVDRNRLLAAAQAVGERLEALALRGEHDLSWIGLTLDDRDQWQLGPLETDLYDGLPGVTLFLAYLGAITGEKRFTELSRAALDTLRRQVEQSRSSLTSIGGFVGWGGIVYTLTQLHVIWKEEELQREAEGLIELLPPLIDRDNHFDVISGAAGCIASLISVYNCTKSNRALSAALRCGEHLISHAEVLDHGKGWIVKGTGNRPLTGFSHGVAGIAWTLLQLSAISGEDRFRTAALDAIAYERRLFSPAAGNWPDLRASDEPPTSDGQGKCMVTWCHGAPGIGLARLHSVQSLDDPATRKEIEIALQTTLAQGFGHNHCLCHGDLGNLELLLLASQLIGSKWQEHLNRLTAIIVESINRVGWLCGNPVRVESPGLMTGLAGIGYQLLRLAEPERVPSVLVLASPMAL